MDSRSRATWRGADSAPCLCGPLAGCTARWTRSCALMIRTLRTSPSPHGHCASPWTDPRAARALRPGWKGRVQSPLGVHGSFGTQLRSPGTSHLPPSRGALCVRTVSQLTTLLM